MPWLIQHKCNLLDVEVSPYAMVAKESSGAAAYGDSGGFSTGAREKFTQVICQRCGEQFQILGHDFFTESHGARNEFNLPEGFVIARTGKA
jgi:hypothetical protein